MHRAKWLGHLPLGELCRGLLLTLLLLVAQQGALLHELSHYLAPETQGESDKQGFAHHACATCLAFAQVHSAATADVALPTLLTNLSFAPSVTTSPAALAAELPSQRNRGPPAFL